MKHYLKKIIGGSILIGAALYASLEPAKAEVVYVDPLFTYPVAPEELENIMDKSNWLMQHFWDSLDFKKKEPLNQAALNDAFRVYSLPMQFAEKTEVEISVDNLLKKIQKNPTFAIQFMKGAEDNLYGPKASIWIDEVYMKFLNAYIKNKKIKSPRKIRYERQLKQLENSKVGATPTNFTFTTPLGNPGKFEPRGVFTVIEFGDPDCEDCRMAKLKLDTDVTFSSLVDRGLVNMMFIAVDPEQGWETKMASYPEKWVVGASSDVAEIYDLRQSPSFYVIGKDGKIMAKNINLDQVMRLARTQDK